jgi:hypothetical protein
MTSVNQKQVDQKASSYVIYCLIIFRPLFQKIKKISINIRIARTTTICPRYLVASKLDENRPFYSHFLGASPRESQN